MAAGIAAWSAEFRSPESLLEAARALREQGYSELELHTPYEIEAASEVLGLRRPQWLPRLVLVFGLTGAGLGYGIQWLTNGWLYPLVVGGRPPHSPPAFIPITFEGGILLGALAAFVGLLAGGKLMRLWQPIFEVPHFERASVDRFWLVVDRGDPRFDADETRVLLESLSPLRVEPVRPVSEGGGHQR